jgi:putative Ca2+/H+ antiporter (TMEM165/GDT1 family)
MEAFAASVLLVAVAEIGDKTQLLSLYLAARYRSPGAIVAGIAVSTLANHALAGALGAWVATLVSPDMLRWILGIAFLGCAVWALFADTLSAPTGLERGRLGVFLITVVAFFVAEMGDKTQLATVALAAKYSTVVVVVLGSTVGMMVANAPVVYAGERLAKRLPLAWARRLAALLFALTGVATLAGWI